MKNYHLVPKDNEWVLHEEGSTKSLKKAATKDEMLLLIPMHFAGKEASVKIHRADGTLEEERTYPRKSDPRESKG
ncbi:hypothetical protein TUM18999_02610 [Pseudomonas tohonis]|uniref:DUF2188 domain-containing protein n=1 Tax=Pseudomonas tohonis TaxID=2725477 RepID=A0A6J4DXA9_9PSED|nr:MULTISPECIES: DUF2188 domain-containing protein [Pseudomonas]PZE13351.1 DUF2188 domain-containing protein [Pseudomonas sp. 57B-090624]BCG22070.1 hypothetical protein TUM18999_02610 [Pseudomonas tohonis]GJN56443.1 hypothetical protein TUM20286_61950 [Pseudomonas tohonis]